jgi:hypothetical protein
MNECYALALATSNTVVSQAAKPANGDMRVDRRHANGGTAFVGRASSHVNNSRNF